MLTADEALARLKAGNERFVRGEARFPTVQKEILAHLTQGQQPYATSLGCSDSRVPPELFFEEANVRWSMYQLLERPEGKGRVEESTMKLVGAIYELQTGRVRFLS